MGAQRRRITWRYAMGDVVYVRGTYRSYTVEEQHYAAIREPPSQQVTYRLKDEHGATFLIIEAHMSSAPPWNAPGPTETHR